MALHIPISVGREWHFDIDIVVKMTRLPEKVASCKRANRADTCRVIHDAQSVENSVCLCGNLINALIFIDFLGLYINPINILISMGLMLYGSIIKKSAEKDLSITVIMTISGWYV